MEASNFFFPNLKDEQKLEEDKPLNVVAHRSSVSSFSSIPNLGKINQISKEQTFYQRPIVSGEPDAQVYFCYHRKLYIVGVLNFH